MNTTSKKQLKKPAKPHAGRPSLSGGGPTKIRSIKVPEVEWDAWTAAALKAGQKAVAPWLRQLANKAAEETR